jgi:hypothetical protein
VFEALLEQWAYAGMGAGEAGRYMLAHMDAVRAGAGRAATVLDEHGEDVRVVASGARDFMVQNTPFVLAAGAWLGEAAGPALARVRANIDEWVACASAAAQWSVEQVNTRASSCPGSAARVRMSDG